MNNLDLLAVEKSIEPLVPVLRKKSKSEKKGE